MHGRGGWMQSRALLFYCICISTCPTMGLDSGMIISIKIMKSYPGLLAKDGYTRRNRQDYN